MKTDRTKSHNSISEFKYIKANSLFRECKGLFGDIFDDWSNVADEEEREFYRLLSNYFLQQRQKEVIDKRLF